MQQLSPRTKPFYKRYLSARSVELRDAMDLLKLRIQPRFQMHLFNDQTNQLRSFEVRLAEVRQWREGSGDPEYIIMIFIPYEGIFLSEQETKEGFHGKVHSLSNRMANLVCSELVYRKNWWLTDIRCPIVTGTAR